MNNSEIKKITKACQITDLILKQLIKELKQNKKINKFQTELDIYNYLKQQTYKNKNCRLAFKPIIATKENAATIHHKANNTKLKRGFLVIDFGVKYQDYCSDCTRTFYLGKPTKEEIKIYNLVLSAQETSLMYAKPGEYGANLDLIARQILEPYFRNFKHALGHGVGKRIHQAPGIYPKSKSILKENQVITIEPGLYLKNKFGIRIEDTILIKDKPIILTKITKELIII